MRPTRQITKPTLPFSPFLLLFNYCLSLGAAKLGDVTAKVAIDDYEARTNRSALDTWYRQGLNRCASDDECKNLVKRINDDTIACWQANSKSMQR